MSTLVYERATAPGFAKHTSTFKTDESCVEALFVVGTDHDEVYTQVKNLFTSSVKYVDYDVNYSAEAETFVGIVVVDV